MGSLVVASPTYRSRDQRAVPAEGLLASRDADLPVSACGTQPPQYSYTLGGISSRKQDILNAGGDQFDIAISMQEVYAISPESSQGISY